MKCSIQGCPGQYEAQRILHTLRRDSDILVFEHVPAEVCTVCGDTLLAPETIEHLEKMLRTDSTPGRTAPVFDYV